MADDSEQEMLIEELRELVGLRILIVLAPALRALEDRGRSDLRKYLETFAGPLERELRRVLSCYEVRRRDD